MIFRYFGKFFHAFYSLFLTFGIEFVKNMY
nr:MAG TPA: hypothetical protein [Caudoviricetes sp.]